MQKSQIDLYSNLVETFCKKILLYIYIIMKRTFWKKKKSYKLRNRIIIILLWIIIWSIFQWNSNVTLNKDIIIQEWDNFATFTKDLSKIDSLKLKFYAKLNWIDLSGIEVWTYSFSGDYTKDEFFENITQWPGLEYASITLLEWWTSFDIDNLLTDKWLIEKWEYIALINNKENIEKLKEHYEFLALQDLDSLEWYLYPDTYFIDIKKPVLTQLTTLQLNNFETKVRDVYSDEILAFSELNPYEIVKLASIVEKEEKNLANQPTVAWILLNRINDKTLIWADITLCYWLELLHKDCTPSLIVKEIYNKENPYNTRQNVWLTPTPIANPTASAINSVINYNPTDYYYYLHSSTWQIYYAKTLQEHNSNKQYL